LIKSEALILRRFRHGETSLVVHVFTKEHGRVPFIAKGARAGGKRSSVPLVPLVLLEVLWKQSTRSEMQLIREVSLIDGFGTLHNDLDRMAWGQAAIETLGRTLTGAEPHKTLFDATVDYLTTLTEINDKHDNLFSQFRLMVLRELGYAINMDIPENPGTTLHFIPSQGKVTKQNNTGEFAVPVHMGSWKLLSILNEKSFDDAKRLKIPLQAAKEIEKVLDSIYRHAFDSWKPLQSLKLIKRN